MYMVARMNATMKVKKAVPVSCYGVNHADFSLDGRYFGPSLLSSVIGRAIPVWTVKER